MAQGAYGRIYLLRSQTSGKSYVGQTTQALNRRWRSHKNAATKPSRTQPISNAIRKYGADDFEMTLLDECDTQEELDAAELRWATELRTFAPSGYNLRAGSGPGSASPEVRAKMSELMTDERREHLRQLWKGRRLSDEAYENARASRLARMPVVTLLSPAGDSVLIEDMAVHAKDYELSAGLLWRVAYGERLQHGGWRLVPESDAVTPALAIGLHRYRCPTCEREWESRGGQHKADQHATLCERLREARQESLRRGYITQEQHDRQLAALTVYRKQARNRARTRQDIHTFTLAHRDGRLVTHVGYAKDFAADHGLLRTELSKLLNGKIASYKGWIVVSVERVASQSA